MNLRISAGAFKGRKLYSDPGKQLRPISGMIKEALFSIIAGNIKDCVFLDLFAGSGSVGLEALSRGAAEAVFVEKNIKRVNLIKENIFKLKVQDRCKVVHLDVFNFSPREKADIVFAGPPYKENLSEKILSHCLSNAIIREDNLLVIQHHKKEKIGDLKGVRLGDSRKYGKSRLDFFVRESCIQ